MAGSLIIATHFWDHVTVNYAGLKMIFSNLTQEVAEQVGGMWFDTVC